MPAIPWNRCPPCRGNPAHDPVESVPAITWNTHVKALERDLARKEKALAEAAALLVLRKNAAAIWGDGEDA